MNPLNRWIANVLMAGLLTSVVLLAIGAALTVALPDLPVAHVASLRQLPGDLVALHPVGFFTLGLLVLLATPVAWVVALLVGFVRRRMWLFSFFSAAVLLALAISAYFGFEA